MPALFQSPFSILRGLFVLPGICGFSLLQLISALPQTTLFLLKKLYFPQNC